MAPWGWVAVGYGAAMVAAAACAPVRVSRRAGCAAMAVLYAAAGWALSPLPSPAVQLLVPGTLLLTGYWLPGLVFGPPQPALEAWLMRIDRRWFTRWSVDERLRRLPAWVLEGLEACYFADYLAIGGGAVFAAVNGTAMTARYWTAVLAAELLCYAALPWLRSRPPRTLEPPGPFDGRGLTIRRLNLAILGRASVQANTLPSGHVAGAVAAAAAIAATHPLTGIALGVLAALIAAAAVLGRYHYLVDVVAGAMVALAAVWLLG